MKQLVIDPPNEKQKLFFAAKARYIAYGGARAGGKSWAMRIKFSLLCLHYDGIQILLLRRTLPELRENHVLPLRTLLKGIAVYNEQKKVFVFPNGARLVLGYCAHETDVLQYQGQAYDVIGMEEATMFTEFQFNCLRESNRSSGLMKEPFAPRMYLTMNPGGVGHHWVKRLFVDRSYKEKERPEDYVFIPARVYDNKVFMERDPDYVAQLESLPEKRRRAMLLGDWTSIEGAFFEEFMDAPEHYQDRQWTHVIAPFDIPDGWKIYRSFDWGYWVANNFIWGWMLLPITQLGELIKQETATDEKNVNNNSLGYFSVTAIVCALWTVLIPTYKPFMQYILGYSDVDKLFGLVMVLFAFYILYAFQNVFDCTFYGRGKTNYMLFESVVTNSVYYGTFFILYLTGAWTPTLIGIALMFGIGNAFDSIVSGAAYAYFLKKNKYNILDVK